MPRSIDFDTASEVIALRYQQQDQDFCRALHDAIYAGTESCPVGVSTEPGTKKPILNYHRSD
jgi:hypothetical protein